MTTPRTNGGLDSPLDLLVVASWYPSIDDTTEGRFVADQVEALLGSGRARPTVVTFEPLGLTGSAPFRSRQAAEVVRRLGAAFRADLSMVSQRGVSGPAGARVARLPVPGAPTRAAGPAYAAVHRAAALGGFCEGAGRAGMPDPMLLHAHTGYPDGAAAARVAARLGRPLIVTEHSSTVARYLASPAQREWYLGAVAGASRFLAVSETLAIELRSALPEASGKIVVVPNAVPVDDFAASPRANRVADQLLFVGYLKETKGIATLLDAFARVRAARPTATLVLVGRAPTPELQARWEEMATRLGVHDAVRFEGALNRTAVAAAMARASLFVHPSPRETFGVVAVEALASGLPVVAADSGGVTEILGPNPASVGAIVPTNDPAALASAILANLERADQFDPELLRATVVERYGSQAVAARLLGLYRDVVAEWSEAPRAADAADGRPPVTSPRSRPAEPVRAPRPDVDVGFPHRVLAVGFDRARTAVLLGALPAALRRRLIVVTSEGPHDLPADLAALSIVRLDKRTVADLEALRALGHGGGRRARLGRFIRNPLAVIRRRVLGWGEPAMLRAMTSAIRSSIEATTESERSASIPGRPPLPLVAVDGLGILAAGPLADEGLVKFAPGGVRWLADRWLSVED